MAPTVRPLKASREIGSSALHRGVVKAQLARAARPSAVGERSAQIGRTELASPWFSTFGAVHKSKGSSAGLLHGINRRVHRQVIQCCASSQVQRVWQVREDLRASVQFAGKARFRPALSGQLVVSVSGVSAVRKMLANNSLNRTRYGRPPWPGRRHSYHVRQPGQGALPPRSG